MMLLDLPDSIFTSVISDWLGFSDVGVLDCGISSKKYRGSYLSWLRLASFHQLTSLSHKRQRQYPVVKPVLFQQLSWLHSRLGVATSRLSLTVDYVWNDRDVRWGNTDGEHSFPFVKRLKLSAYYLDFKILQAILCMFPSMHTLEIALSTECVFESLQVMITHRALLQHITSLKMDINFSPDKVPSAITSEFLRHFAAKLTEGNEIELKLAIEFCRHFTSFGDRSFSFIEDDLNKLWPLSSQLSGLQVFDFNTYGLFFQERYATIMFPSIAEICSAYSNLTQISFSKENSSIYHALEVLQYSNSIQSISSSNMVWQRLETTSSPSSSQQSRFTSELHISRLGNVEEDEYLREFLHLIPPVSTLHVMLVFGQYGEEDSIVTRLLDVLLPHVKHVQELVTTFVTLMAADARMLQSLDSFSSVDSMHIINKQVVSDTLRRFIRDFDNHSVVFAANLPKLRRMHMEGFQEFRASSIKLLAYHCRSLDALRFTNMDQLSKNLFTYLTYPEVSRVWASLIFRGCRKISRENIYEAVRFNGLLVKTIEYCKSTSYMLKDFVGSDNRDKDNNPSGYLKLGYGRVPLVL